MPELPEVETVCRGLAKALIGARFTGVEQHRPDLRTPLPKNLAARLQGRRITAIRRRAKYVLVVLDNDTVMLLHLGMSGRMVLSKNDRKPPGKHDHLVFHFDNGVTLRFNDPRRFGMCDLMEAGDMPAHRLLRHLGIEPLEKELTPAALAAEFKGKKASIKVALMDQRIVVGIGNIYACEALFHAGINPKRKAGACSREQLERLVPAIRNVLAAAIKAGGSSLRDYVQSDGELGYFQHHFAVYDREGKRCPGCRCKVEKTGGVKRITQGGRSTFYCATKQV